MSFSDLKDLQLSARDCVLLDFDGTLADIVLKPGDAKMPAATAKALERLHRGLHGALAIISGRDIRDLAFRVPQGVWRVGGHGLEICPPGGQPAHMVERPPPGLLEELHNFVASNPGVHMEVKGPIVALHFRAAPEKEEASQHAMQQATRDLPGYVVSSGKMVVEAKPLGARKDLAVHALAQMAPFEDRRPIMIGDDKTDETAFEAALELGGIAVKVGPGETLATWRAPNAQYVREWIEREAARLDES